MKTAFLFLFLSVFSSIAIAQVPKDSTVRDEFVDVSQEPKMIDSIEKLLVYPETAIAEKREGRVILSVLIGKTGIVEKAVVDRTTDSIFSAPAIDAIKKVRFTPALQGTAPVKVWWTIPVVFKLD